MFFKILHADDVGIQVGQPGDLFVAAARKNFLDEILDSKKRAWGFAAHRGPDLNSI
jgi:hypothetical protein